MAAAATGALATSHEPSLHLLTRLHHLNSLERSLPHHIAMDLLDGAAQDCAKRSSRPRPCRQPRGRKEHYLRSHAANWLSRRCHFAARGVAGSPLRGASQRGAVSNVERSTHEAAGRGRRRGRGLVVLRRAAATECAGARQAGRRDQCRQRECVCERLVFEGLSPSPGWAFNANETI